jgi:hypothetical protein
MFQRFFTSTIESKFVKSLLENTPIPVYPSISLDGYAINGCIYVSKYGIIKCTKTGKLSTNFIRLYPYIFGQYFPSFTEKYVSKYNYYDTNTHEVLGNYLRLYRDLFGIDLMPFYNCFSYRFFEDMYLTSDTPCGYVLENNKNYILAAIPIKFDKTYTVASDCQSSIKIKAIFHDSIGHLVNGFGEFESEATEMLKDCPVKFEFNNVIKETTNNGVIEIPYICFNRPIKFELKLDNNVFTDAYKRKLKCMEKYLYLIVQFPAESSSSIVALEGNYTNNNININYYNIENSQKAIQDILSNPDSNYIKSNIAQVSNSSDAFDTIIHLLDESSDTTVNKFMHTDLSLLKMGTANMCAFNNRIIEYLLLNVVDSEDTIDENTIKAQKVFNLFNRTDVMPGVWSNLLRFSIYRKFLEENKNVSDINGFIDKDVEKMITRMDGDY